MKRDRRRKSGESGSGVDNEGGGKHTRAGSEITGCVVDFQNKTGNKNMCANKLLIKIPRSSASSCICVCCCAFTSCQYAPDRQQHGD